jgi:hypothetical protein
MRQEPLRATVLPLLGRLHLVAGLIGVAAFLVSGLYMDRSLAHLAGMEDAPRALYRSGHIYLLFASLLHLGIGAYLVPRQSLAGRMTQYVASLALLAALVLFAYGFAVETPLGLVERPMTRVGIELAFAGTLLHAVASALFNPEVATTAQPALQGMHESEHRLELHD